MYGIKSPSFFVAILLKNKFTKKTFKNLLFLFFSFFFFSFIFSSDSQSAINTYCSNSTQITIAATTIIYASPTTTTGTISDVRWYLLKNGSYVVNNQASTGTSGSSWYYSFPMSSYGQGLYYTAFVAYDTAGNIADTTLISGCGWRPLYYDITAPVCGTWSPTSSPWKTSGTQAFTLSGSTDALVGISTAGGSCTTGSTNNATCTVTISDRAGNTRVCTSPVNRVDATAPTCGTWSPTSSPWKTSGTQAFTLSGSTDTGGSGISTAGGSCTTSSTNGATCTVTISDVAGNTRVCTSPVNRVDATAPSGGSISYSATTITSSTQALSITVADGTDSLAGINTASRQLLRQEAVLTNGTCGSYGTASSVSYSGTYPNITTTNFEANRCYKYQWSVSDNVGNNVVYSSSTIVTSSGAITGIKDVALGSFVSINSFNFIKVNSTGLLIAATANQFTQTFTYTGAVQTFTAPYNGWYQIETWGAKGGDANTTYVGGKGAYLSGKIYLNKNTQLSVYVGGMGNSGCTTSLCNGGWNGGGHGWGGSSGAIYQGSGGGATDIRYNGTSIYDRIMVAAGGGGGSQNSTAWFGHGGGGGDLNGLDGSWGGSSGSSTYPGYAGTQLVGGAGSNCAAGTFANGGTRTADCLAGGGAGYYGGGCGWGAGGGGGSSFISGFAGVNTITSSSSLTPTYNTTHYSGTYFLDGKMEPGTNGNAGSAKITYISRPIRINTSLNNIRYIKDCINGSSSNTGNHWVELQAIVNGINVAKGKTVTGTTTEYSGYPYTRITDGDITSNYAAASTDGLQCITVDLGQTYNLDEVAVWHYWADKRIYSSSAIYTSSDNANWNTINSTAEGETASGKRISAYSDNPLRTIWIKNPKGGGIYVANITLGTGTYLFGGSSGYIKAYVGDTIKVIAGADTNFSLNYLKFGSSTISSDSTFTYNNTNSIISSSWKRNDLYLFYIDSSETYPMSLTGNCDGWCSHSSTYQSSRHYVSFISPSNAIRQDFATDSTIDLTDFNQACSHVWTVIGGNYITGATMSTGILSSRSEWVQNNVIASISLPQNPGVEYCGSVANRNGNYYVALELLQFSSSTTDNIYNYVLYVKLTGETYQ